MNSPKQNFNRPPKDAPVETWQNYADELEGQMIASERRARYLQDQLNGVISTPLWKFLRRCREFIGMTLLGRFPRARHMAGVLAREGPSGVWRRLKDGSISDHKYAEFLRKNALTDHERQQLIEKIAQLTAEQRPLISILTPVYNTPAALLRATVESVKNQIYQNWELCLVDDQSSAPHIRPLLEKIAEEDSRIRVQFRAQNGNISRATQDALEMSRGLFVATLDHDDTLTPDALARVALCLAERPDADLIYSDHDMLELNGLRSAPYFKPDWAPDMFLSNMYLCHLLTLRAALVRQVGGFRPGFDGSQDYDLVLRFTEQTTPERIRHISRVLYSWRRTPGSTARRYSAKSYADDAARRALRDAVKRRGIESSIESGLIPSLFRVKRAIKDEPLVSILIPFRDQPALLARCLQFIRVRTNYKKYELILVDNGSRAPETQQLIEGEKKKANVKVLRVDEPFNYSRLNNLAAREAAGAHLLLLNNDIEALETDWLTALLEHSQRPEVGAVGAKLLYEKGVIQHAGVIVGIGEVAGHAHRMVPDWDPGYFGSAFMIRNFSAVTGACLMTRRALFLEMGGLNETELAVAYNDVDYCLRLREKGFLIVYTPYAKLRHYESATRGLANNPCESAYMCRRWAGALNDPYYNPNLNPSAEDFSLAL
ncbi:MAG: glycosyltransferase family 2 protein [Planctomycetota bacterium]